MEQPNQTIKSPVSISVIIPAYNARQCLSRAIGSVLDQTCQPSEIIVIDDGSTDRTSQVAQQFKDRVRYVRQDNAGASAARNRGVSEAACQWIAFLDADDTWLPDKLRRQADIVKANPELAWVAGAFSWYVADVHMKDSCKPKPQWFGSDGVFADALEVLSHGGLISTITILVRRDALDRVGPFDTTLRTCEDVEMWSRLAIEYPKLGYVQDAVACIFDDQQQSLSRSAVAAGDQSVCTVADKLITASHALPRQRQAMLKKLAWLVVKSSARNFLLAGQSTLARSILRRCRNLDIDPLPLWIRLACRIPQPILTIIRPLALHLRSSRSR